MLEKREVRTCDGCGTDNVECESHEMRRYVNDPYKIYWLCDFCAYSTVDMALVRPDSFPNASISRDLAKMLNTLKKDLKERKCTKEAQEAKREHSFLAPGECGCDDPIRDYHYCPICEGGLRLCKVCGLEGGWLTTECPGYDVPYDMCELVGKKRIDFVDGKWVNREVD